MNSDEPPFLCASPVPADPLADGPYPVFEFRFYGDSAATDHTDAWQDATAAGALLTEAGYATKVKHGGVVIQDHFVLTARGTPQGALDDAILRFETWAAANRGEYKDHNIPRTRIQAVCLGLGAALLNVAVHVAGLDFDDVLTKLLATFIGGGIGLGIGRRIEHELEKRSLPPGDHDPTRRDLAPDRSPV